MLKRKETLAFPRKEKEGIQTKGGASSVKKERFYLDRIARRDSDHRYFGGHTFPGIQQGAGAGEEGSMPQQFEADRGGFPHVRSRLG